MERCNTGGSKEEAQPKGMIYVVGTGPGDNELLTPQAREALVKSDVIVGYKTYLDQIEKFLDAKEVVSSSMMQEVQRCEKAFELADKGKIVSIVSGGDAGIYAMAGLILEIASHRNTDLDIEIVPGIAALNGCAARLGAPLMHDFATVSLSDLLTPMELIERRLHAASSAEFVIVIYNPKSKKRVKQIQRAKEIVQEYRPGTTPVGIVTAANRENEKVVITTLDDMLNEDIGMQSTVIIGNSSTYCWNKFMITPRGYRDKYELKSE